MALLNVRPSGQLSTFSQWLDSRKPWVQNFVVGVILLGVPVLGAGVWKACTTIYPSEQRARRAIIERLSDFIEEGNKIKAGHRVKSPNDYDATDPGPAVAWESTVCDYLTKARDRSYCLRFKNRLPPLDNPANQRRDGVDAGIDARIERLEQFQIELAKPAS